MFPFSTPINIINSQFAIQKPGLSPGHHGSLFLETAMVSHSLGLKSNRRIDQGKHQGSLAKVGIFGPLR